MGHSDLTLPFDARATICPRFMPNYASLYYVGLHRYVRSDRMVYERSAFSSQRLLRKRGFSLILSAGGRDVRLHFDSHDPKEPDLEMLEWCDVYAKANVDSRVLPAAHAHKVLRLGPFFGLRIWDVPTTLRHAVTTLRALGPASPRLAFEHLHLYRLQFDRGFEDWYAPGPSDPDYLFFTAWAWAKHPEVNPPRAEFIRIARACPGLVFEGGFAPRRRKRFAELRDVTAPRMYPMFEYLSKMKRSCVAFNTPAVHQCLGWKLGEFLALGKAIISLPLTGELPEPLVHGEHIHYVSGDPAETRDALERIRRDHDYRRNLERNARRYYETYLSPQASVRRVLEAAFGDRPS